MRIIRIVIGTIIALALLNWIISAFSVKSLTGSDIKRWFTHTDTQKEVYQAQVTYLENRNLSCANEWGGVDSFIKKIKLSKQFEQITKKEKETPEEEGLREKKDSEIERAEKCLEQIIKGSASPRDDIPKMVKGVADMFSSEPDLVWTQVGEMKYTPNQPNWQTQKITVPAGESKCRIRCIHGYDQYFANRNHWSYVTPEGWPNAQNTILEDMRYTPLAQLIKVGGVTNAVNSQKFNCNSEIEASFISNQGRKPIDVEKNRGQVVFVVEKLLPKS